VNARYSKRIKNNRGRKIILGEEKEKEPRKKALCFPCSIVMGGRLKRLRFTGTAFFIVTVLVFIADQLSKLWVIRKLDPGETLALVPDIFHLTYVRNPGAAFGILPYKTSFFIVVSLLMILFIAFSGRFIDTRYALMRLALSLQLGGLLGNFVDRLRTGYVVDFLDFRFWPVFNLADTALFLGVALLFLNLLCGTAFSPRGNKGEG